MISSEICSLEASVLASDGTVLHFLPGLSFFQETFIVTLRSAPSTIHGSAPMASPQSLAIPEACVCLAEPADGQR
ncbi:hypothetical protein E2C01_100493 [Portunus trituberculatus]|uniref:Uncharacterized protein n=1 Tax=Portunus trituberculatus TaxID=210409 RepID=A0A5B7KD75_PORTR|nr:hypothetical protein [Portunus trituberculatus]